MSVINFEHTAWFIPLCLLIGAGFSYLLYSKKSPWGTMVNRILIILRFILISLLAILLLNPLFKQFSQTIEKPLAVIAIDNSKSIANNLDSMGTEQLAQNIAHLREALADQNYKVEIHTFTGLQKDPSKILFDEETSDLKAWLDDIQSQKEGMNMTKLYLFTDGIFNQGISPAYFPYNFGLNTVGLGDTLRKADLVLKNVYCNKIAYKGNRFPILAEINNYGFENEKSIVEVWSEGKLVDSEKITFTNVRGLQTVKLEAIANTEGYRRLTVLVKPLKDEVSSLNNRRNIYVDVVDGKQKILLIAPAPHPDLKTLSAVIDQNDNYELELFIPGISEYKNEKYDLVIAHASYDRWNRCKKYIEELKSKGIPFFHIIGKVSRLTAVSREEPHVKIVQQRNQRDMITGSQNSDFKKFTLSEVTNQNLSSFPPLNVPYAQYELSQSADVLLYQKVGSVITDRPLLFVTEENNNKTGFLLADDIWKWRMQEYALNENTDSFDEIFTKVVQYLSTKVDKRKFRFSTSENEYYTNDVIDFRAELYNDIYERVYNEEIKVKVFNGEGFVQEASFVPVSSYSSLELSGFEEGTYQYEAEVTLDTKKARAKGVFVVKEMQLEQIDQVADFDMLRRLSLNSDGKFYNYNSAFQSLLGDLDKTSDKSIIHTEEEILPVIHLKWLLFVFILIVSVEWLSRKYLGGY